MSIRSILSKHKAVAVIIVIVVVLGGTALVSALVTRQPQVIVSPPGPIPSPSTQDSPTVIPSPIDCGAVQQIGILSSTVIAEPSMAISCFWNAYQSCQSAKLVYQTHGVDTSTTHTVTLSEQSSMCSITDVVASSMIPPPRVYTTTYSCKSLQYMSDILTLKSCGNEGDITIQ